MKELFVKYVQVVLLVVCSMNLQLKEYADSLFLIFLKKNSRSFSCFRIEFERFRKANIR